MSFLAISDQEKFLKRAGKRIDEVSAILDRVDRISRLRIAVTVLAVVVLVFTVRETISGWWVLAPVALFAALAILHERRMQQARARHRMADLHRQASKRIRADLEDREDGDGAPTEAIRRRGVKLQRPSLDEDQLAANRRHRLAGLDERGFGRHLDLFGAGRVFDRVAGWRTDSGGETLAWWLLNPAPPAVARARQAAIRELTPRVDLREALAATGALRAWPSYRWPITTAWLPSPFDSEGRFGRARRDAAKPADEAAAAAEAGPDAASGKDRTAPEAAKESEGKGSEKTDSTAAPATPEVLPRRLERLIFINATLATAAFWGILALALAEVISGFFFLGIAAVSAMTGLVNRRRVVAHEDMGYLMERDLAGLREIIGIFEREEFRSIYLHDLQERVTAAGGALERLIALHRRLRFRRNLLFAPIGAMFFYGTHHALALDRWRRRHGDALEEWMGLAGEFDALMALAQYAEERPAHIFAEFDDLPGIEAVNLGHPLIPEERLVRNTVTIGRGAPEIMVVTGSNMSGKSTLLRALGVNFLLARMGAPVNATSFRTGPMSLGVSIEVHDSLRDGVSRFLAELFALRQVLDTGTADQPLFFLLDEILQGTNSDDRRAAVFALVRELARRRATGVMTTHDLSLTELAHELPRGVVNRHFSERIEDGVMDFDYDLREGPLTHGNALELMRMLNLPTPRADSAEGSDFTSLPGVAGGREH